MLLETPRPLALLELSVLFTVVALDGGAHQAGDDNLSFAGLQSSLFQLLLKILEQRLDEVLFRELLPEQPEGLGTRSSGLSPRKRQKL
ncbi:hypothetical protein [Nitrosococcus halophilus]|uniref:hypothetical protein n=1 Tax=Nitrosococcus halophilus TaxID=133539 RepID=UPI001EF062EC|nr:hypothetical protein [Nitrosococcus halophilus]